MAAKAGKWGGKVRKKEERQEKGDVESVWTSVVEQCGKRGGMWRKKQGDLSAATANERKKRTERENSTEISTMWKRPSRDTDISTCRERKKTSRPVQRDG